MPFLWRAYQFTSSLHISLFVLRKLFLIHHPQPKRPSFFIHSICCNYNNQNELILFLLPFQDNQSATHLPLSSSSIMKTLFQILILLATTVALVSSQGTKIKDFPLSVASSVSCDTIVTQSSFGGDCCALNRTDGGGCVLNVINGYCKIRGQTWSLDYTSLFDSGGAKCPPSELPMGDILPTAAPSEPPSSGAGIHMPGVVMLGVVSVVAAATMAILIM